MSLIRYLGRTHGNESEGQKNPWQALTYDANQGGYVVNIDRSRLGGAPTYASSDTATWDDPAYGRRINDYYGV